MADAEAGSPGIPGRGRGISEHVQRKLTKIISLNGRGKRQSTDYSADSSIKKKYRFVELLGNGASAKVFIAESTNDEIEDEYAIKSLPKLQAANRAKFEKEVKILSSVSHPNIVGFIESDEDQTDLHIVMEFFYGGELYDKISQGDEDFAEEDVAQLISTMLHTLSYLHLKGIVHQDIKPSNWVYKDDEPDSEICLIDFGDADFVDDDSEYPPPGMPTHFPFYRAPEYILQKQRTAFQLKQSDVWGVGVIAYILLHGIPPFPGNNAREICTNIIQQDLKISDSLPPLYQDFISKILEKDPMKRMTVDQALEHEWLSSQTERTSRVSKKVLTFLRNFHHSCKFKQVLARRLARTMTGEPFELMRDMFRKLDSDGNGFLNGPELIELIKYLGWSHSEAAKIAPRILVATDHDADGRISFDEFSAMWQAMALSNDDHFVHAVFDALDTNKDGEISLEELKEVLKNDVDGMTTAQIFCEVDLDKNGKITFDEFKTALEVEDPRAPPMVRRQSFIRFERTDSDGEPEEFLKQLISSPGRHAQENQINLISLVRRKSAIMYENIMGRISRIPNPFKRKSVSNNQAILPLPVED